MLSKRQLLILQVIIEEFIRTAQPIGSRAISKRHEVTFSPATIRNDMADLEELGYLEKTHSSSGRVPSEKGYRFYVDHLLMPIHLSNEDQHSISNVFNQDMVEFEKVIQNSVHVLSDLTNYTSIILGPEVYETTLKQIQIIHLSTTTAVAILVTNTGHVEHRSFTIPKEINPMDLEKLMNILNERLIGVPIVHLHQRIKRELSLILDHYIQDMETAFNYLKGALLDQQPNNLYVGGITNMLLQPEFSDVSKIHSLYSLIEKEDMMTQMLRSDEKGIHISIGNENELNEMKDCSIITATYSLQGQQYGTIALIGPKRMEYSRVVSLLESLSGHMTNTFKKW